MAARVPLIDMARLHGPDRAAFVREVDTACRDIGFLLVVGHGVAPELIRRMHAVSAAFFRLPAAEKRPLQVENGRLHGWTGPRQSYLADTLGGDHRAPDWKEGFSVGPVDTPPDLTAEEAPYFGRNLWPARPEGFVEAWQDYFREMERLAGALMATLALALGLPQDYFENRIDRHITGLSAQYYPPQPVAPEAGQLRAGAHTDFGSLTILSTGDDPGGLQVRDHDGTWQDVTAPPDAFVVNIGDLMAQWANDRWVSTLHRVTNPRRERAHLPRQSIAFFHQPNWHALVECLPGCGDAEHAARYAPITSGAHFERKLALLRGTATQAQDQVPLSRSEAP
jgi:isopenicillin N synthase-like dioxygenase